MAVSALGSFTDGLLLSLLQSGAAGAAFLPSPAFPRGAQPTAGQLADVLAGGREHLLDLALAAAPLDLATPTSLFYSAAAASSSSAIDVHVIAGSSPTTTPVTASYTFTVSQLAVAQTNVGNALTSSAASGFTTGTNTFRVTQDGTSTDVSFSVGTGDTNLEVLTAIAAAINGTAGLGIEASVRSDAGAGTSQLVVQASDTGTTHAFTLADVTNTAVADAGVASASTAAANAAYTQDGVAYTSSTNELYPDARGKLRITLRATSSDPVVVEVAPDASRLAGAVGALVNAYNAARAFFEANPDAYPGAASQLASVGSRLRARLDAVGIRTAAGGALSVDSAALAGTIAQAPASLQSALGAVGGLAKELHALGDTQLAQASILRAPFAPSPAYGVETLAGRLAVRLQALQATGLLIDALI